MKLPFKGEMLKRVLKNEDGDAKPGNHPLYFVPAIVIVHDRPRKRTGRLIHDPIDARFLGFQNDLDHRLPTSARRDNRDTLAFVGAQGCVQFVKERLVKIARHVRSIAFPAATCLLLSACATGPTKTETVTVQVPVATHPIAAADVPALPAPLPKRPADARAALDVALAQVCRFVAYGLKADTLLRLSAGLPPQESPKYPECER